MHHKQHFGLCKLIAMNWPRVLYITLHGFNTHIFQSVSYGRYVIWIRAVEVKSMFSNFENLLQVWSWEYTYRCTHLYMNYNFYTDLSLLFVLILTKLTDFLFPFCITITIINNCVCCIHMQHTQLFWMFQKHVEHSI